VYCGRCGTAVAEDARFCPNCGAAVETPAGEPTPQSAWAQDPQPASPGRPAFMQAMPASVRLASAWRRLGGHLLEVVLVVVTLVVGWLVWSVIVWGRGQTPAKQLLGMRVVHRETLTAARRGRMFAREVPCKWVIGFVAGVTIIGWVAYFWLLWDSERQELWDKMVETIVVTDPDRELDLRRI
jgi:uncharacterized RDD family membrane protein YckC